MISDWDENLTGGVRAAGSGWGRSSFNLKDNSSSPSQTRAWRESLPATGHAKWLDRLSELPLIGGLASQVALARVQMAAGE